jgi:hypothetical protein
MGKGEGNGCSGNSGYCWQKIVNSNHHPLNGGGGVPGSK